VTWTSRSPGGTGTYALYGVAYGSGIFVAVGADYFMAPYSGTVATSSDGIVWTHSDPSPMLFFYGVTYANGTFVAVGVAGTVYTSPNGSTWTAHTSTSATTNTLWSVTYGNGTFVAVGASGTIVTSTNGTAWTLRTSGTTSTLWGVTYGSGLYVAVGSGTVCTSSDAALWTSAASADTLRSAAYGNGTFVAVGNSGDIVTSANGTAWAACSSGTTSGLYSVIYGDSMFVTGGGGGTILRSSNQTALQYDAALFQTAGNGIGYYGTAIHYSLLSTDAVVLTIYDLRGKRIKTLVKGIQPAGRYSVQLPVGVANGAYVLSFKAGEHIASGVIAVQK
jgi:hypothetical protein